MNKKHQFFFMAGLPRTGSTVLSSVLSQNPKVYAGPYSPVCQVMRDLTVGLSELAFDEMKIANRADFSSELIKNVPELYYKNVEQPFIVDKNRDWLHPRNVALLKDHVTPDPKILVLTRDKKAIMDSFKTLWIKNSTPHDEYDLLCANTEKQISFYCDEVIPTAKANNKKGFWHPDQMLFIEYEKFMANPNGTFKSIYSFFGWEPFTHNFTNIKPVHIENDFHLGPPNIGMHEVRPILGSKV
tara:strand:- start:1103 stop:1828 length:726 start_codon:yes stop_codon:yes gene_type:complete